MEGSEPSKKAASAPQRRAKAAKAPDSPAPSEGVSGAPAGYDRVFPREVTPKTSKKGRFFWAVKLELADGTALTSAPCDGSASQAFDVLADGSNLIVARSRPAGS